MDDKIFDNIKVSKKLSSVVDIAIDNGIDELELLINKEKKSRRKKMLAASAIGVVCFGAGIKNEEVKAGVSSVIDSAFRRVKGSFADNITYINNKKVDNGVELILEEAMINGDELVIAATLNHENIKTSDWKINKDSYINFATYGDSEIDKLEKTLAEKIFSGEEVKSFENIDGIDYSKIEFNSDTKSFLNHKIEKYKAMYEWGQSNEEFYKADSSNPLEFKDKKGAIGVDISLEGEDIVIYDCVLQEDLIGIRDLDLIINGEKIKNYEIETKTIYGKEDRLIIKVDISDISEKDLNVGLEFSGLEIDTFYPVVQKVNFDFNFDINYDNALEKKVVELDKNIEFEGYGSINISSIEITDATIKVNYISNIEASGKHKNSGLTFRVFDAKTLEEIHFTKGDFSSGSKSNMTYENTSTSGSLVVQPILIGEDRTVLKEFDRINIDFK